MLTRSKMIDALLATGWRTELDMTPDRNDAAHVVEALLVVMLREARPLYETDQIGRPVMRYLEQVLDGGA